MPSPPLTEPYTPEALPTSGSETAGRRRDPADPVKFRDLLALAALFAVLLSLFVPLIWRIGASTLVSPAVFVLLLSPWLLGMTILIATRTGPLKFWLSPILLALMSPALALWHDWTVFRFWRDSQIAPNWWFTIFWNVLLIGTFAIYLRSALPKRCPKCKRVGLIPLRRFWGPEKRTRTTRWCGGCGSLYWRDGGGAWREERRDTWLDMARAHQHAAGNAETVVFQQGTDPAHKS